MRQSKPGLFSALRLFFAALILYSGSHIASAQKANKPWIEAYREPAGRMIKAAMADSQAFQRLAYFGDHFGHRLSGSKSLERSINWLVDQMRNGLVDTVYTQDVKVPHWVRGDESATLVYPRHKNLPMLGLGGSIKTPDTGITAEVLVVKSYDELKERADEAKGRIVVYNVPFTTYGKTVRYRMTGAVEAAKAGAVASLIRTVGPFSMKTPHTGTSRYQEGVKKIPHAALTIEDVKFLQRLQDRGITPKISLKMDARTLPDALSHNVVAEIRGNEEPGEVVVMGGHIDSWDVGQGVMDDAGGCFAAWEALRLMKKLNLQPRRTVRLVMWTNEENGLRGGRKYRSLIGEKIENHIMAIESDEGVFKPKGFGFNGSDSAYALVKKVGELLQPIGAGAISRGGGGADISPLMQDGVPGLGLDVDGSRYFWYHHSAADTIDKLDDRDYRRCIAAMAIMAYTVADMPRDLPR